MCLHVRTRQFLIAAHVRGLVEIISDEGRLQDYGEVHGELFYKYANENILIKLPDSTKKNCSILCVRINPGYICTVPVPSLLHLSVLPHRRRQASDT